KLSAVKTDAFSLGLRCNARGITISNVGKDLDRMSIFGLSRSCPLRHLFRTDLIVSDSLLSFCLISTGSQLVNATIHKDHSCRLYLARRFSSRYDAWDI